MSAATAGKGNVPPNTRASPGSLGKVPSVVRRLLDRFRRPWPEIIKIRLQKNRKLIRNSSIREIAKNRNEDRYEMAWARDNGAEGRNLLHEQAGCPVLWRKGYPTLFFGNFVKVETARRARRGRRAPGARIGGSCVTLSARRTSTMANRVGAQEVAVGANYA